MADEAKLVNRVQALYAKAASTQFEEERNALIEKADEMVRAYALEAALADASRSKEDQELVTTVKVDIQYSSGWYSHINSLLAIAARQNNCYPVRVGMSSGITLVGHQSDIDFTQMLFAMLQAHFIGNINPSWNPALGLDENVYLLKEAGIKWRAIRDMAVANGHDVPWTEKSQDGRRLIKAYRRHCEKIGVPGTHQTQSHEEYRQAFAMAYLRRLEDRLREMNDTYDPDSVATGGALALRSRMDKVMDMVYELFPDLHPEARKRAAEKADREWMQYWNSLSEKEKAAMRRVPRMKQESASAYNARHAGRRAGTSAADSADLTPGRNDVNANARKAIQ